MAPHESTEPDVNRSGSPDPARTVVIVAGARGAGKTELSSMIARTTGYPRLEKDLLSGGSDREQSYRTLMDLAADIAANGSSVILDAGFMPELADPGWLDRQEKGFELLGAKLEVILVQADPALRAERMLQRGMGRDRNRHAETVQQLPAREPSCTVINSAGIFELLGQAQAVVAGLGLRRDT